MEDILEVFHVLKKNKLRAFLTGFSVAWGIFILVTLLGLGNSLKDGVMSSFKDLLQNKFFVTAGITSMNFSGLPKGRAIELKYSDYEYLIGNYPSVEFKSPEFYHTGIVSYKKQYKTQSIQGVSPDLSILNNIHVLDGRFINKIDINERKKVIVISSTQKGIFFKNESCVGKYICISNRLYLIVGVYRDEYKSADTPMYIPFTTLQSVYNKETVNSFVFTVNNAASKAVNDWFIASYRNSMSRIHQFDPADQSALRISDTSEDFQIINGVLNGVRLFIWIIGISTLLSGIVGVNNITMISVRERTREFGIRKTIGATPFSIIKSVMIESVMITLFAGYVGILLSCVILEVINTFLLDGQTSGDSLSLFNTASIDIGIAVSTNILLVVVGVIAGFIPARKAVSVSVVDAINKI